MSIDYSFEDIAAPEERTGLPVVDFTGKKHFINPETISDVTRFIRIKLREFFKTMFKSGEFSCPANINDDVWIQESKFFLSHSLKLQDYIGEFDYIKLSLGCIYSIDLGYIRITLGQTQCYIMDKPSPEICLYAYAHNKRQKHDFDVNSIAYCPENLKDVLFRFVNL